MVLDVKDGEFREKLSIGDVAEAPDLVEEVLLKDGSIEEVALYHTNYLESAYIGYLFSGVLTKDLSGTLLKVVPDLMYLNPNMGEQSIRLMQDYLYRIFKYGGGSLDRARFNRKVNEQILFVRLFGESTIVPSTKKPIFILYKKDSAIPPSQKRMLTFASSRVEMDKRLGEVLELAVHTALDLEHPLRRVDSKVINRNIVTGSSVLKDGNLSDYTVGTYMSGDSTELVQQANVTRPIRSDTEVEKFELFLELGKDTYAGLAKAVGISKSKVSKFKELQKLKVWKDGLSD